MERCIQDLGAGVAFLRSQGYKRVVLIGNSGGGSLAAFYQSQAERLTINSRPTAARSTSSRPTCRRPTGWRCAPRIRAARRCLTDWLDPSVIDEADMLSGDPALDMFNPRNGPPFSANGSSATARRSRRATSASPLGARAPARLRRRSRSRRVRRTRPFLVFRTAADPRFVDLTLDPSDRKPGTTRGSARASNYGVLHTGRTCSLRSWLTPVELAPVARRRPASASSAPACRCFR